MANHPMPTPVRVKIPPPTSNTVKNVDAYRGGITSKWRDDAPGSRVAACTGYATNPRPTKPSLARSHRVFLRVPSRTRTYDPPPSRWSLIHTSYRHIVLTVARLFPKADEAGPMNKSLTPVAGSPRTPCAQTVKIKKNVAQRYEQLFSPCKCWCKVFCTYLCDLHELHSKRVVADPPVRMGGLLVHP